MKTKQTLLLVILLLCAMSMAAQPSCRVRTFTIHDGLAANTISGFAQTDDDLIWLATWNGLCCFDGYNFMTFRGGTGINGHDQGAQLSTVRMHSLRPTTKNDLWCITYDNHLYLFDTRDCRYRDVGEQLAQLCGEEVHVRAIYTLGNGHSWVVSRDGVANFCVDDSLVREGRGITAYLPKDKPFKHKAIHKVLLDDDGREWVFTDGGATIVGRSFDSTKPYDYMVQLGKTVVLATPGGEVGLWQEGWRGDRMARMPQGVSRINALVRLDDRRAVAATDAGIVVITLQGTQGGSVACTLAGMPHEVKTVFADRQQRLWVFTDAQGVTLVNTADWTQRLMTVPVVSSLLATTSEVPVFHQDKYGTVWLIPTGGTFAYYDEQAGRLVPYILASPDGMSLWEQQTGTPTTDLATIAKFMTDRQDNLWFTGMRALTLVNFMKHRFVQSQVVPNQEARAVCVDRQGRTWVGMFTGEVAVVGAEGRVAGWLTAGGGLQPSPVRLSNRVYSLFEDSRGRLWIGTKGDGIYVRTPDGRMAHYRHGPQAASLSHDEVYGFDEDPQGRVWIATYGGGPNIAVAAGDGSFSFVSPQNGMKGYPTEEFRQVRRITHDGKGNMILSTTAGLLVCQPRSPRASLTDASSLQGGQGTAFPLKTYVTRHVKDDDESLKTVDVLQVLRLKDDSLMVVTQGGGVQMAGGSLLRDGLRMKTVEPLAGQQSLPQSLVEDKDGSVWVVRESSIDRYDRKTGRVETFSSNELGELIRFSEAQPALNATTGEVVLPVVGGSLAIQPRSMKKSNFSPKIVFTGVKYQGEQQVQPVLHRDELTIEPHQRSLTLNFAALDYEDNALLQYAYRMDEEEGQWNYLGRTPQIAFSDLTPGRHTLVVRSTNCDGVWVDNETTIIIDVEPTWLERGWVRLLLLLTVIGLATWGVVTYLQYRQQQQEREQRMENLLRQYREELDAKKLEQDAQQATAVEAEPAEKKVYRLEMPEIVNPDEEMMSRLMNFIEENIGDADLRIEDLADAVNLGRSAFYGKLKSIVGMTPVDFLRHLRIQHAEYLIVNSTQNFSQIAYAVGFSDPKYFSKCFKKETGFTPSEFRKEKSS